MQSPPFLVRQAADDVEVWRLAPGDGGIPCDALLVSIARTMDESDLAPSRVASEALACVLVNRKATWGAASLRVSSRRWQALPVDVMEFRGHSLFIGSSWSRAPLFERQIGWATRQAVADYSGVDDPPY